MQYKSFIIILLIKYKLYMNEETILYAACGLTP